MAFDQTTRNRLQKFVSDARRVLTEEFTRQLQNEYGLDPVAAVVTPMERLPNLDDARRETAKILRDTLEHYRKTNPTEDAQAILERIVREHAFTVLNRLAALRMAEARGLLIESLADGYNSKGFQLYAHLAGTGLGERGDAYRCYLFSLFDEFALDLRVLFDRFAPTGRLFPREAALLEVLALMNDSEVAPLWAEDETIGWIYQYFNSKEERKLMREKSSAPRNSRELAVRNQFFTPRYVVEFLTDNTLGRIWYEMTKGETYLKEQCRYLVRRPTEIFLKPGKDADRDSTGSGSDRVDDAALSQEELLKQTVYIPHRPLKDPREIRVLDPACGSMHFGLYAFDLLEVIYEEAWELEASDAAPPIERSAELKPLRESYAGKQEFLRDVPRLIIEHNMHGIDIDPRAVQIAGLSLWLRAQRAWQQQGVKPAERPQIRRSNIVCAEPMPGEREMLEEFIAQHLSATPELRLVGQLVRRVFDAMKLAGEAGSLLKIEEEVATMVAEAKAQWLADTQADAGQGALFTDLAKHEQQRLGFQVAEITDKTFWERAEGSIYAALQAYAEQAENGGGYQRRLFAEDAARGFAFIDICRKRYDVALMNPPFGDSAKGAKQYLATNFPVTKQDVYGAFIEEGLIRLTNFGRLGAITSRTGFFLSTFQKWREEILLERAWPTAFADLGNGVLDSAMVETAAFCLERTTRNSLTSMKQSFPNKKIAPFFSLLKAIDKSATLLDCIASITQEEAGNSGVNVFIQAPQSFCEIPGSPFAYWISQNIRDVFRLHGKFENDGRTVKQGLATADDFRFMRAWCEVPANQIGRTNNWSLVAKGGLGSPFYSEFFLVVNWANGGAELKAFASAYRMAHGWGDQWTAMLNSTEYYFKPGFTYPLRSARFSPQVMPEGVVISVRGSGIYLSSYYLSYLALIASRPFDFILKLLLGTYGQPQFDMGDLNAMPTPNFTIEQGVQLATLAKNSWQAKRSNSSANETSHAYLVPALLAVDHYLAQQDENTQQQTLQKAAIKWDEWLCQNDVELIAYESQIDDIAFNLYGLYGSDRSLIESTAREQSEIPDSTAEEKPSGQSYELVADLISYQVGTTCGRFDIRFATGEKPVPELPDPFAPLPVCLPGMLQNEQGLPAAPSEIPASYPLRISWSGILVDDKGHAEDIERRVREALHVIWQERADAIEQEACEILGVKTLRDYFRKPAGFFADHLQRYSKSRRQAPIYWPLSTRSGTYTLWLYYHRLNDQTLYSCVNEFVDKKLKDEITPALEALRAKGATRSGKEQEEFERLEDFEQELQEFRDELLRLAKLPWRPNLNDGVQITAAPLWKLFRLAKWQKTLKETWVLLEKGDYDWAHLAMTLWPQRVVPKCAKDRSLAIAHDVEDLFWVEDGKGWRALQSPKQEIEEQKRRQHSDARDHARQLLAELAQGVDGRLSAADVSARLVQGEYDDRELALLLYPERMAEAVWESPTLAQRLGVKLPAKKTKAAREKYAKEIVAKGCADLAPLLEAALDGRAKSFAEVWREVERGTHDELGLALALWPDRVVDKCAEDAALAEQHGLRRFFWVQHPTVQWRKRVGIEEEINNEVARRRAGSAGNITL